MPEKARVAVLISGRGSNLAALLHAAKIEPAAYEIVLVASNNPEAPGLQFAAAEGVRTWAKSHRGTDREAFDAEVEAALREADAEYIALAGYMRVLSAAFVDRWAGRILNVHPSLLPKYKGLDTHARAIEAGDAQAGCSVHIVTAALDDGPVLGQIAVPVLAGDTPEVLAARIQPAEHQLFPRILSAYVSRYRDRDWLLGQLGERALALPEAEATTSHGAPAFKCRKGKIFAHFSDHHHGEDRIALLVKTGGEDEMAALIEADPERYHRPAYYGASGWIGYRLDRPDLDWDHVAEWLAKSWQRTAPKSLTKLLDAAAEF